MLGDALTSGRVLGRGRPTQRDKRPVHIGNSHRWLGSRARSLGWLHRFGWLPQQFGDGAEGGRVRRPVEDQVGLPQPQHGNDQQEQGVGTDGLLPPLRLRPIQQTHQGDARQDEAGGHGRHKIGFARAPFARRGAVGHGRHKPNAIGRKPLKIELVHRINPRNHRDDQMQVEPLCVQRPRLPIHKFVDVGRNGVRPPVPIRCPVNPQKDGSDNGREGHTPDERPFPIAQKHETKDRQHGGIGELFGVARQHQQNHHPEETAPVGLAGALFAFVHGR